MTIEATQSVAPEHFQSRVQPWLLACFGAEIASDTIERNHRFLEEALELVQACGATASEAHQLVDYTFSRPVGETPQEVGGIMVTLAALCLAQEINMHECGETELNRIWTKVEQIRQKQAAKPKHSPLPAAIPQSTRQELQAEGKHHAPCARFCESNAYELELRQLRQNVRELEAQIAAQTKPAAFIDEFVVGSTTIVEVLEIGLECANEVATTYHAAMDGYRLERHKQVDADVRKIEAAIAILKAELVLLQKGTSVTDQTVDNNDRATFEATYPFANECRDGEGYHGIMGIRWETWQAASYHPYPYIPKRSRNGCFRHIQMWGSIP